MEHWRTEIQKGKNLLSKHDAAGAVRILSRALEQCPAEDSHCLTKALFYLGIAMKKLGLMNSAIKLWVSAYKIRKNRLVRKMIEYNANGYGMMKQANPILDDKYAFFSIQIMRYIEKKSAHAFSTHAEKDVVYELIEEHWKKLSGSGILDGKTIKEKRSIFHREQIVFPFFMMPKVLGDTMIKVNFSGCEGISESLRCGCGSGLPFSMCCGRTVAEEEIINGIF